MYSNIREGDIRWFLFRNFYSVAMEEREASLPAHHFEFLVSVPTQSITGLTYFSLVIPYHPRYKPDGLGKSFVANFELEQGLASN